MLKEAETDEEFGVKVTSVYINDRIDTDVHTADIAASELVDIPYGRRQEVRAHVREGGK